jgi:hypothetical protein
MAEGRSRRMFMLVTSSSIAYAFGFLIARLVFLLGLAAFGWIEGREPFLSHGEVVFNAAGPELADLGGLLVVLGLAIVLLLVLPGPGPHGVARLTVLWTMLHLFLVALQTILAAPFNESGIGATIAGYLHVPDRFLWILAAVAGVAIIGMGIATGPFLLRFAPKRALVEDRQSRLRFLVWLAVVPWLVGGVVAIVALWPFDGLLLSIGLTAVLVVAAVIAGAAAGVGPKWDPTIPTWPIVAAVLLVIVFWLFRFALRPGFDIPPWG